MRALASHQFCAGWNLGVEAICGFSLLLVLIFALRSFPPSCSPVFPLSSKPNISKLQFDPALGNQRTTTWLCYLDPYRYLLSFFWLASRFYTGVSNPRSSPISWHGKTGSYSITLNGPLCTGLSRHWVESVSVWFRSKEWPRNLRVNYFLVLYQRISYSLLSAGSVGGFSVLIRKLKGSLSFYLAMVSSVDWILTRFDDKKSNHTAIFFPDKALVSKNQTHTSINAFCMTPETQTIWSWQHALTLLIM